MRRTLSRNHYFIFGFLFGLILSFYIPEDVWEIAQDAAGCPGVSIDDEKFGEGFEPHLNLINKPLAAKKRVKTVIRPRYYSSELGIREKLFIGVMTSQENINTYATAINRTTAHLVNKIKFFINADNVKSNFKLKNIVGFTDTRENLRPFHILKYIADNYLEDYDYFLIMPDTVYVDAKKFKKLLYHISISFDIYMGRRKLKKQLYEFDDGVDIVNGGVGGSDNGNKYSKNIESDHNYCDLNAGILLSSSVIRKMRTNLDWCVRNANTNIHSINIGRCVKYSSKVTGCQDNFQEIEIKSYEFENVNLYKDLKVLQKDSEFRNSTIIYPMTSADEFYILHAYFARLHLDELRQKSYQLEKKCYHIANGTIPNEILEIHWPLGTIPVSMPETRHDILTWHFINRTHTFMPNHENAVEPLKQIDLKDLNRIINITISYVKRKYRLQDDFNEDQHYHQEQQQQQQQEYQQQYQEGKQYSEIIENLDSLKFEKIHSIYRRFDPIRGMDYHLHFVFLNSRTNERHIKSFYVVKPLGRVEIIPSPYVTESTRIAILLPTFEHQIDNLDNFVKLYEKICMENQDNTFLMLIFLYNYNSSSKGDLDPFRNIKQLALDLSTKYKTDGSRIAWVSIRLPQQLNEISLNSDNIMLSSIYSKYEILSLAVTDLSLPKIGLDSLILLGSNAMTFKADFLNRVRMNTIQGFQIFSPIAFMTYPCKAFNFCKECDTCDVSQANGYFDKYNFDVVSFYSRDYVEARKKIENSVPIIRTDNDIELLLNRTDDKLTINNVLDMFLHSQLTIHTLRGIEPNLRYGNTIKNFIKKRNSSKNLPNCPYNLDSLNNNNNNNINDNEIENIPNRYNENKYNNLLNNKNNNNNNLVNKCIHLAARKHIGDAILRYEDNISKTRN